jgi:8-oxo-dGTP diphosphatase
MTDNRLRAATGFQSLDFQRPLATVDVAIFAIQEDRLHVLLVQRGSEEWEPFPRMWALPGGFVDVHADKTLSDCAVRKLREKTGVASPYLEQLGTWGDATRDPRGWSMTCVYFALIPTKSVTLEAGANAADVQWFPIVGGRVKPRLAFDHDQILEAALLRLRNKVEYTSLPVYLMPSEFTLPELQRVYEVVLDRPLEKSAFRTRILSADVVEPIAKTRKGPNRPAQLYRLKRSKHPTYFVRTFNPPSR